MYPHPNNNQGFIPPNRNQGFDSQGSSPQGESPNYQNHNRTAQPNSNIQVGNTGGNAFAILPLVGSATGNSVSSAVSSNQEMSPPANIPGAQAFMSQNLQAQANATMMMMNSQQLMGGIFPLNIMGMMPGMMQDPDKPIKKPKKRRKKPKDRPKRPLSAYNLFFKDEREKILKQIPGEGAVEENEKITWPGKKRPPHGKISFEELAKTIGTRWKALDNDLLSHYKKKAEEDLERYAREMRAYEEKNKAMEKSSPVKEEEEEDFDMKVDVKRQREEVEESQDNYTRKKSKKPPKKDHNMFNVEMMNQAFQNNLMAMKIGGNFMFPMIVNPGMINMANMTPQQTDQLKQQLQAQQQHLIEQATQKSPAISQFEHSPPQQQIRQSGAITRNHSFGLGENELFNRPDSSQQLMGFDQNQHQHHDLHKNGEPSTIGGERDNSSPYEFNYNNMNLNDQGTYQPNNFNFTPNNGPGPDDTFL